MVGLQYVLALFIGSLLVEGATGENIMCESKISETSYRSVTYQASFQSRSCKIWGGCSYRTRYRRGTRSVSQTSYRSLRVCCPGYEWNETSKACEKCAPGFYGNECSEQCRCQNNETCDHVTGRCTCTEPGWTGQYCNDVCHNQTFGVGCNETCACLNDISCDPRDGACICPAGKGGITCQEDLSVKRMKMARDEMTIETVSGISVCIFVILLVSGLTFYLFVRRRRGDCKSNIKSSWCQEEVTKEETARRSNIGDSISSYYVKELDLQSEGILVPSTATEMNTNSTYEYVLDNSTYSGINDSENVYENQVFAEHVSKIDDGYNSLDRNDKRLTPKNSPVVPIKNYDHILLRPEVLYVNTVDDSPYDVTSTSTPPERRRNSTYDTLSQG